MKKQGYTVSDFKVFVVTGRYYNSNRRFSSQYEATTDGARTALSINLWNGSVYGVLLSTGKRVLLKRVYN